MEWDNRARAAVVLDFCITDTIAQQQMVMLYWWQNDRMKNIAATRKKRAKRRWWVKPWRDSAHELETGEGSTMFFDLVDLEHQDACAVSHYLGINSRLFYEILARIEHRITKRDTNWRFAHSPRFKLIMTLRFLVTGTTYSNMQYGMKVSSQAIGLHVIEVCLAIWQEFFEETLKFPDRKGWEKIIRGFENRWNVPNCFGAIDGKHIRIKKPNKAGSDFFNYKRYSSVVLMALVDSDYKFIWVDVGYNGGSSDSQIWAQCELNRRIEDGDIDLPPEKPLPHDDRNSPYFVVADDAFALKTYVMKQYRNPVGNAQKVFNYRISRGRLVVENAFGILAQRLGCFLTTLQLQPQNVKVVIYASVVLHNLIRIRNPIIPRHTVDEENANHDTFIPGLWRQQTELLPLQRYSGNRATQLGKKQRELLTRYFQSRRGRVWWQDILVN